jgi:hypothetical protein
MSWFTALFSSPKTTSPVQAPTGEKRILEEPVSTTQLPNPPPVQTETQRPQPPSQHADQRNRNKVIFSAGLAFFAFSLLITRRAFARKRLASNPAFYTNAPGHHAELSKKANPAMEAFEALNIATVNVLSLTMMATGGTLWYLNINNMDEARRFIRGGIGVDGTGRSEKDAEEDFEEWMATVLARKEAKEGKVGDAGQRRES